MMARNSSFEARAKASSSSLLTGERVPGCLAGGKRVADEFGEARVPACLGVPADVLVAAAGEPALPAWDGGEAAEERDTIRGRLKPAGLFMLGSLATAGGLLRCALMLLLPLDTWKNLWGS